MSKKVVGVVLGDAAGIGPELVAKSAATGFFDEYVTPVIIGDVRVFEAALKVVGMECPHYLVDDSLTLDPAKGVAIYNTNDVDPAEVTVGTPSAYCGKSDINMMLTACRFCKEGKIAGFCYGVLHKGAMKDGGMHFESESEMMADCFGLEGGIGEINMLGNLMTMRVTSHIPLKDVSAHLNQNNILRTIELAHATVKQFGVSEPRLAVAGLNPHNGEGGKCGTEEIEVIRPAVEKAIAKGWNVEGPMPADTVFMKAFKGSYDAVVTMFHDQGQIALKVIGFDQGVTICGGMPYPITTAAHGTALEIAGKGIASTSAFENAVKVLARMAADK